MVVLEAGGLGPFLGLAEPSTFGAIVDSFRIKGSGGDSRGATPARHSGHRPHQVEVAAGADAQGPPRTLAGAASGQ